MPVLRLPSGEVAAVRARIDRLERIMERAFRIPVIRYKVGLDALLGLVPGAGDAVAAGIGLYLVWEAWLLGVERKTLLRMLANVGVDAAIGTVPVAGDLFDFVFRSNSRNLKLLRRHIDRRQAHA